MIESLTLHNFRNFSHREISFCDGMNLIIWENGMGKTNILEALSLPASPLVDIPTDILTQKGTSLFSLQYRTSWGSALLSYDAEKKRKKYSIEKKSTTKAKLQLFYPLIVSFHPEFMNLLLLWPSHRRNFLDYILSQCYPEYGKILTAYTQVLRQRNKILSRISEGISSESEILFWDEKFVSGAKLVCEYRKKIEQYFSEHLPNFQDIFAEKWYSLEFCVQSKIDRSDISRSIDELQKKYAEKERLLWKTLFGPHLDDFSIMLDQENIEYFASRGEIKSVLLALKFLEAQYLQSCFPNRNIVYLIDDLLSELDTTHREKVLKFLDGAQCIITSIEDLWFEAHKIYL